MLTYKLFNDYPHCDRVSNMRLRPPWFSHSCYTVSETSVYEELKQSMLTGYFILAMLTLYQHARCYAKCKQLTNMGQVHFHEGGLLHSQLCIHTPFLQIRSIGFYQIGDQGFVVIRSDTLQGSVWAGPGELDIINAGLSATQLSGFQVLDLMYFLCYHMDYKY